MKIDMEDQINLNVLWVDDMPTDEFMDEAYEYGLSITPAKSVNTGLSFLKDKSVVWDAIILDANCKITEDEQEQPSLMALKEAVNQLVHMRTEIPWFVYTGGDYEGVEHLKFIINERGYDDRFFYEKPKQRYELFDIIKKAVDNSEAYLVRQKHAAVCNFYKDYDLVELLLEYNNDDFDTDSSVPNRVRQIIEWVMRYLEEKGLLSIPFTGANIAKCSMALGEIHQLVPIQVARSMHFCVDICNDGSHDMEVSANIVSGDAPYLNKSLILNLLNILHWCPSIEKYEKEELKKKVEYFIQINKEDRENRKKKK